MPEIRNAIINDPNPEFDGEFDHDIGYIILDHREDSHRAILENRIRARGWWLDYLRLGNEADRETYYNFVNNADNSIYDRAYYNQDSIMEFGLAIPLEPVMKAPAVKTPRMVTVFGEKDSKVPFEECVFISFLNGYVRATDTRLKKDYLVNKYHVFSDPRYYYPKGSSFMKVFTGIEEDGKLIWAGDLTTIRPTHNHNSNVLALVFTKDNADYGYVIDEVRNSELFNKYYGEDISKGIFRDRLNLNKNATERRMRVTGRKRDVDAMKFFKDMSGKPFTYSKTYGKKYSFGLEIETISGYIPAYVDKDLYCSYVHDGSLRDIDDNVPYGLEYVTCVLRGDEGLRQTKRICYELTKRCLVNKQCGVHVHIGSDKGDALFTKENIVLMYYLYAMIQGDIFEMLPRSRKDNEYCRFLETLPIDLANISPKNSNRKFWIEEYYATIVNILSLEGGPSYMINKREDHPLGHKCQYNHRTARYCWVNFITSVFNTRGNNVYTIEFRPMSATTSYTKIKNWLLICFALVDIVENHKQAIYSGSVKTLNDVITNCYPKDNKVLLDYIKERKAKFAAHSALGAELLEKVENMEFAENEPDNNYSHKSL